MQTSDAVGALSALAHEGRLNAFRLLVRAGPGGLAAGEIARHTGMLANTLSAHLGILNAAGLTRSRREGRSILYRADYDQTRELIAFLMEDCCGGEARICAPLAQLASRACAAEGATV